jgi:hypothetical protein
VNRFTHHRDVLAMPGALADKKRVTRSPAMKVTIPSVIGLPPSSPLFFAQSRLMFECRVPESLNPSST